MLTLQKQKTFTCYSLRLFHFLKSKGFYYLSRDFNKDTGFAKWTFEKTPEFKQALDEFDKVKYTFK